MMRAWESAVDTGPLRVVFTGPDGKQRPLVFGPEAHGQSGYQRPGDEWGTGFSFATGGCWHIHLTRDDTSGDVWLNVPPSKQADAVRRVDVDGAEGWQRLTDEPDIRGVEVIKNEGLGSWSVTVWFVEFAREEPLESDIRRAVAAELRRVLGVTDVAEEDREVWVVSGSPSGELLARAAARAIDGLANRARAYYDSLGDEQNGTP
jgi:hypothetical protein